MNSYVQLISLVSSSVYGVCLYYFNKLNYKLIKDKNIISKIVISILYLFNVSLVYVCFLYKLNGGVLHVYNILFMLISYILLSVKKRK